MHKDAHNPKNAWILLFRMKMHGHVTMLMHKPKMWILYMLHGNVKETIFRCDFSEKHFWNPLYHIIHFIHMLLWLFIMNSIISYELFYISCEKTYSVWHESDFQEWKPYFNFGLLDWEEGEGIE